jgi:uncharacterized protein YbjT (DUF2867 family)
LVRAARGVDAVYAMSTPFEQGAEKETAQGMTLTDAAKAAGVAHLIYSSVASANRATGIPHSLNLSQFVEDQNGPSI